MPHPNYLSRSQMSAAKSRLTRAKKKGPAAVIAEVESTFQAWNDGDFAYPDQWHNWRRAAVEAEMELLGLGCTRWGGRTWWPWCDSSEVEVDIDYDNCQSLYCPECDNDADL